MKRKCCLLIAWILTISMVLSGCGIVGMMTSGGVSFSDIEYIRPDVSELSSAALAVEKKIAQQEDIESLMDGVYAFYEKYHDYYTNYALANIYYCKDLTDIYWEQEYNYCLGTAAQVDSLLDNMLYALADCPLRPELEREEYFGAGFFDSYEGQSVWNDAFVALLEQEAALEGQYYELSEKALDFPAYSETFFETCGAQMAELLVELVKLRQEIAAEAGYEDYLSFAYDFYYYRDYTPTQAETLIGEIQKYLVPLYRDLPESDTWAQGVGFSSTGETLAYVRDMANAMGGDVKMAFTQMEQGKFYDISYGENKYDASFEIFLSNYAMPYVFVNPQGTEYDHLTFAHEFGHFCKDYVTGGSMVGVDVAEIFSQGMEYLSLCYGSADHKQLKLTDSLCLYVEQAGYASFEQQLYTMEEPTVEKVYALYDKVGKDFGFDVWEWDNRSFVYIPHFFTDPIYVISYVVSNDTALQFYELEQAETGRGLEKYQDGLSNETLGFLTFLEDAGLESPFASGRMEKVAALLKPYI